MKKNLFVILTYIAVYILTSVFAALLMARQIDVNGVYNEDQVMVYAQIFMGVIGFILMFGIFRKYFVKQFKDFKTRLLSIIIIGVVGYVLLFTTSIITSIIVTQFTSTDAVNQSSIVAMFENSSVFEVVLLSFSIAVLIPIVEEMTFRKGLFGVVGYAVMWFGVRIKSDVDDSKSGTLFKVASLSAIIGSSLLFGLLHVLAAGDYIYLISYAGAGIVLGSIYHISGRNIYASIITHIIQNTIGVIVILASM